MNVTLPLPLPAGCAGREDSIIPVAWKEAEVAAEALGLRRREGRLTKEDWAERVFSTNLERKLGSTRELCLVLVEGSVLGSVRICCCW